MAPEPVYYCYLGFHVNLFDFCCWFLLSVPAKTCPWNDLYCKTHSHSHPFKSIAQRWTSWKLLLQYPFFFALPTASKHIRTAVSLDVVVCTEERSLCFTSCLFLCLSVHVQDYWEKLYMDFDEIFGGVGLAQRWQCGWVNAKWNLVHFSASGLFMFIPGGTKWSRTFHFKIILSYGVHRTGVES